MLLVERDEQLARLAGLLVGCVRGRGAVVLLGGPATCGRTSLLEVTTSRAADSGFLVLSANCSAAERDCALGVVSQFAPGVRDADGLVAHVRAAAAGRPVLLRIDDVHEADADSLRCLLYLVRRLRTAPVLAVFTEVPRSRPDLATFRTELLDLPHCHRIRLGPLSRDGVELLLADRLGPIRARTLAAEVWANTGGNPLLVHAVAEDDEQAAFTQAVLRCVRRADRAAVRLAGVLALLGAELTPADLSALTGTGVERVTEVLTALSAAGILDGQQFRHPAARTALAAELSIKDRRELGVRAARLRYDQGASALEVAGHLLAAGHSRGSWGPGVLRTAAEQALLDNNIELAVRCLELALRCCQGERERLAIQVTLARVEWRLNPVAAARHLDPLITAATQGRLGDRDGVELAALLLWHGRLDAASRVLAHSQAPAGELGAEWLARLCPPLAGELHGSTRRESVTEPWLRWSASLPDELGRGGRDVAVAQAEQILRGIRLRHTTSFGLEPLLLALLTLIYADRNDLARPWCERMLVEAAGWHSPTWLALLTSVQAEIALRQGELLTAQELAASALDQLGPEGWGVVAGFPRSCLVQAATQAGDYDLAAECLAQPVPETMFQTVPGLHYLYARGGLHLAMGRWTAALADFLACGDRMAAWRLDLPGVLPWRAGAAQALHHQGQTGEADRLIEEQLALTDGEHTRSHAMGLRLRALHLPFAQRPRLLTEAVAIQEDRGDRIELARTLLDLACAFEALGDTRRAAGVRRQAGQVARQCGAVPLYQDDPAVAELAADRLRGLSEAERRVAALAVLGYTNQQIAARLVVTSSTVEQHLTRVYRKLRVRNRAALPAVLVGVPATGARRHRQLGGGK
ncbi:MULTISPECIES: LuxR C-terminal-related transcriptional regulator [unclassified Crossiella]|uniref:LuxR C-terminal-related transcriptional regulator n=1 Tax=unclassified Crossiella TaxID=2620835 RepID=UPI001FFF92C4|nr:MULTISPECIES: LuxR family transcriptional regulator [unclassified Crossiella]MCK2244829.1 LuxR C-terminal-related transcriptional regulator [Crossiella sp. S99.2]MCK2258471.1 LuxR C-terminal-related transcriptional regulator [Crossiella sp. S99.1]